MDALKFEIKIVLEKEFPKVQSVEEDQAPTEEAIQHLIGYIAGLERSTNMLSIHQAHDDSTFELVSMVKKMERFRRTKEKNLGNELSSLGEPVWKILIQLIIATEEPKDLSVAELSYRISMPKTTTLRYIHILESKGYILHSQSQTDQFDGQLLLTKRAQSKMRDTLRALNALLNGDQKNQSS